MLSVESNAAYALPRDGSGGYLLFFRDQAVYAQPFDAGTVSLSGEPRRVADDVTSEGSTGRGHFSASVDGAVAYFQNSGTASAGGRQSELAEWHLAWVGRTGQRIETPGPSGIYRGVELGPDEKRILAHRHEKDGGDIWVFEPTGAETRLTWDASQHNASPIWSPDGRSVVFSSIRNGKVGLYEKPSDGSGIEELLFESELPKAPMSWSPDGKHIVFGVQDPKTGADLWLLSLEDKEATPFIATPYAETHAQISPDGKWIAYASDSVDDRREIHVQAFPSGAGHWQVSDAGGDWPRWRADTKELLYHSLGPPQSPSQTTTPVQNGPLYSVTVDGSGTAFVSSAPVEVLLLQVLGFPHEGGDYHTYAMSPDAQRFLYFQLVQTGPTATGAIGPDSAEWPDGGQELGALGAVSRAVLSSDDRTEQATNDCGRRHRDGAPERDAHDTVLQRCTTKTGCRAAEHSQQHQRDSHHRAGERGRWKERSKKCRRQRTHGKRRGRRERRLQRTRSRALEHAELVSRVRAERVVSGQLIGDFRCELRVEPARDVDARELGVLGLGTGLELGALPREIPPARCRLGN